MTDEHRVRLGYTVDDDGVWLFCECEWQHNLGFDASPAEALDVAADHVGRIDHDL